MSIYLRQHSSSGVDEPIRNLLYTQARFQRQCLLLSLCRVAVQPMIIHPLFEQRLCLRRNVHLCLNLFSLRNARSLLNSWCGFFELRKIVQKIFTCLLLQDFYLKFRFLIEIALGVFSFLLHIHFQQIKFWCFTTGILSYWMEQFLMIELIPTKKICLGKLKVRTIYLKFKRFKLTLAERDLNSNPFATSDRITMSIRLMYKNTLHVTTTWKPRSQLVLKRIRY